MTTKTIDNSRLIDWEILDEVKWLSDSTHNQALAKENWKIVNKDISSSMSASLWDLNDVSIQNVQDWQIIKYSSSNWQWENNSMTWIWDMLKSVYDPNNKETDAFNQDNMVDWSTNKNYTQVEKLKLAWVENEATKNSTDSFLLNRSNHTWTQTASTISDFDATVSSNANVQANSAKVSFPEAPNDWKQYARQNENWEEVTQSWWDVQSVFGRTGAVVAQTWDYNKTQVWLANVDNTSDADKPVSTAQQTALNSKLDGVTAWTNITIDNSNPNNPIINASWWGWVTEAFRIYSSNPVIALTSSITAVPFNTKTVDQWNNYNTSTFTYVVPSDWTYFLNYLFTTFWLNNEDLIQCFIYQNSTIVHTNSSRSSGANMGLSWTDILNFSAWDEIQIRIRNIGGNRWNINPSNNDSFFWGFKLF